MRLYIIAGRDGKAIPPTPISTSLPPLPNVSVPSHVWKVVLILDSPGQGLSDVTKDTLAFAIDLDNSIKDDPTYVNPKTGKVGRYIGKDQTPFWRDSLISVRDLEGLTGYNFFSNLSTDIQNAIEERKIPEILNKINFIDSAPLMAATDEQLTTATEILAFNGSIRHDSFTDEITLPADQISRETGVFEVGTSQNAMPEERSARVSKIDISSINTLQTGSLEIRLTTVGTGQVGEIQIGTPQISLVQTSTQEVSPSQIGLLQAGSLKTNLFQISSTQVDSVQVSSFQSRDIDNVASIQSVGFQDIHPSEVALPIVVSSQQFMGSNLPSHSLTSNYLSKLQSTLPIYWQLPRDLNITFNITDLPSGQLAEATITGYDTNNRPNSGTLTLDTNGNSLGWFIDTTPDDNSEFDQNLTSTAFRATTGAAAGKYTSHDHNLSFIKMLKAECEQGIKFFFMLQMSII